VKRPALVGGTRAALWVGMWVLEQGDGAHQPCAQGLHCSGREAAVARIHKTAPRRGHTGARWLYPEADVHGRGAAVCAGEGTNARRLIEGRVCVTVRNADCTVYGTVRARPAGLTLRGGEQSTGGRPGQVWLAARARSGPTSPTM